MRDLVELGVSMGRSLAESRMLDTCRIRRRTGLSTDEVTGASTPTYAPVYEGPCRVVDVEAVVSTPEAGGATITVRRVRVDIPAGSPRPAENDVTEILGAPLMPQVVGITTRVVSVPVGTQTTALRLSLQEVS